MSFAALVNGQYELGEQVKTLVKNFGKDSKDRKTPAYYTKKLETLTNWAEQFHRTHKQILAIEEKPDDPYLTSEFYQDITNIIIKYQKVFETGAMQLIAIDDVPMDNEQKAAESERRKTLRNQRALIEALTKNLDEVLANRNQEHPLTYYDVKAQVIEKHMEKLARNNVALWELTDEDKIEDYTLKVYYELEAKAEEALIELRQHIPLDQSVRTPPTPTSSTNQGHGEIDVRLPRITLPKFDGSYQRWMEFKDLFTELVNNANITDAKKMHYLTTTLEGEAKNLIKHLPAIGTNYAIAWSLVTNRYDNKRLLVSTLLHKLMSQSTIRKEGASALKSLHDVTRECIHGLKAQAIPVQHWDAILVHILLQKMDIETQKAFEQSLNDNRRLVTVDETLKFLERRFQSFEARGKEETTPKRTCASAAKAGSGEICPICKKEAHKIYACKAFTGAELSQKWKWVKELNLCINCLKSGHRIKDCKSRHCTKCQKSHHSLLHNSSLTPPNQKRSAPAESSAATQQPNQTQTETSSAQPSTRVSLCTNNNNQNSNYVLLGTARIKLIATNGEGIECRAVLDSGSQINLITDRLSKRLGVKPRPRSMTIEGVGVNETRMRHQTTIQVQSTLNKYTAEVDAHVIPKIVSNQPMQFLSIENWGIPHDIVLADPEFYKPGRIDCLLGAEVFFDLLRDGQIKLADNLPILKNSILGWIVAGKVEAATSSKATCGICTTKDLEEAIAKFWESEELPDYDKQLTEDELHCEAHFLQHTFKDNSGRFVVKLPLKDHPSVLTDSKGLAYERFKTIERRLENNPSLKEQYVSFMREYEALGHMSRISTNEVIAPYYFIPHHCVLRPDSTTTKLRVVFDASAHKPQGLSLNDIMFNGPKVQSELFSILLRFRKHKFVLKTDVEKMFRQIWVNPEDRNLLLIMWRESKDQPLQTFQLNTVTYGTRAAPYLAARCLNMLADEYKGQYPYGGSALRKDFYVDDGLTGADTIQEALEIQQQLITILDKGGMKLKKWSANHPRLLSGITPEDQEVDLNFESKEDQSTKTLGLQWLPKSDVFCIKVNIKDHNKTTKRTMSSDLAHIYDPLGLIGPVLVTGKIQLQKTWQNKHDWDEELPEDILTKWATYRQDLEALENVKFPRYVLNLGWKSVEIHAFADASEKAYGAVVYLRSVQKDNVVSVQLLCSKSRIAPIKQQTIPRLELCAALLAAELVTRVQADLGYQDKAAHLWTDSQIVLAWIHNHSGKLPVYVTHRIVKILRLTIAEQWHHVPSRQNPADILSRGVRPREFGACNTWMYGPMFLYQQRSLWPTPLAGEEEISIEKAVVTLTTQEITEESPFIYSIHTRNNFWYLNRVVAYVLRFIKNLRQPKEFRSRSLRLLSPLELDAGLKQIVRQIQLSDFTDVKKSLIKNNFLPKNDHLSSLTPFLDEEGIIRVGGRLKASGQQYDAIHQMLLPGNDPIVRLLIEKIHEEHYHCGAQALLAQVRQRFWPLKAKSLMRSVVQRCVTCTRAKPKVYNQIMGDLPSHRVQPARPFLITGVDYCGPFQVHFKIRGKRPQKAYIAVFCCFSTKAVHLELVTELTTDAFIGALKRFIGRRGHCKTLYCDNATNFVGARNQLQELEDAIYAKPSKELIINHCSKKGIEFHFIPPRSPHFGGLWEAAVKSAKHLLIKNVSTTSLTYEELETVVIEIEAILNSRPLVPSSSDANDFNALTPGHFLIGEELTSSVDVQVREPPKGLLNRWQLVSQLKHNFWQRWSKEYLSELQHRHKWKEPNTEILPGTMVIIKDDNLPVLKWPLGRIIKTYTGEDGFVRVCDVKTQRGIFKRPVHRLAPLFAENELEEEIKGASTTSPASLTVQIPLRRIADTSILTKDPIVAKRPRLTTSLMMALCALLLLPLALASEISVTKFNNTPGVYFEQLGTIKRVIANWNIIVYFDLEPYQQQLDILDDGTMSLQKLCDNSINNTACSFLLNYFDHSTKEMQTNLDLLSMKRTKRGALDIVGNFANSLFGILDSSYKEQMSNTIDKLKKNDEHIERLFQNQTSLIDSTINLVKRNQLNIQAKFAQIDDDIHQLLFSNKAINDIEVSQAILMLSVEMFMIVANIRQIHAAIMDVLIDCHHDKLNPLLLSPQQLNEELLKIKAHLPANLQLPIHQNNLLEVYRLIKVNGLVAERHVIFNIELPLTDPQELQLLHLVPIAAIVNWTLSEVVLTTRFLAVSPHQDEFVALKQNQITDCWPLSERELLCPNIQATYQLSRQPSNNKCEIDLLQDQLSPRCKIIQLEDTTTWHQLHNPNQWIFATKDSIKLNAVCDDKTTQAILEASGLISLRSDCTIKNDRITIQGRRQITTSLQTTLTKLTPSIGWTKQYTNNNISIKSYVPTTHEFEKIQLKLAQLSTSISEASTVNSATHGIITGYSAIGLILIIVIALLYRRKTSQKAFHPTPIPAPRQPSTEC